MKIFCLILVLSCSSSCFGEDKEFEKKNLQKQEDVNKCEDPKKCVDLKVYGVSTNYSDYQVKDNSRNEDNIAQKDKEQRYDYDDSYGYIGNPDDFAEIERPCAVYDLNCIRRFFAEHAKCKIRRGPLPENVFRSQYTLYFARANVSTTLMNVILGGFRNTRVEEFYINRKTNKMVFAIQMRELSASIPTVYFQYYRNGREPIVAVTDSASIYSSLTLTAIIPNINDLQLEKAEITAFVDALPAFYIGAEAASTPDPAVIQSLSEFYADLPTDAQELMLTESLFYPPVYIQYNICDFGLRINK